MVSLHLFDGSTDLGAQSSEAVLKPLIVLFKFKNELIALLLEAVTLDLERFSHGSVCCRHSLLYAVGLGGEHRGRRVSRRGVQGLPRAEAQIDKKKGHLAAALLLEVTSVSKFVQNPLHKVLFLALVRNEASHAVV